MKKGSRKDTIKTNKKRFKVVMEILEELDRVAIEIIKYSRDEKREIKREELVEVAEKFTDITIGKLEESVLWSKLQDFQKRLNEHRAKQEEGNKPS